MVGLSLAWAILRSRCLCHSAEEIGSWSGPVARRSSGSTPFAARQTAIFTKKGGCRVAAWWCPYRLFAAMAGAVSNLICEAGNEL